MKNTWAYVFLLMLFTLAFQYILNTSYAEKKINIVNIKLKYVIREVYFKHYVQWYNEVLLKDFDIIRLQNRRDTYSWKKMTKKVA